MLEMPETNCSGRPTLTPLAILQWNCHSLSSKLDVATSLFAGYDVLALSETWLTVDSRFLLHDFNVFRKDSPPRFGGGLILAVRSSLTYSYIEDTFSIENKLDTQAIIIHFENLELSIISIYRNPNGSLSREDYNSLFAFCQSFSNAILVGDFNAHHNEWGSERTDNEGENLLSAATEATFSCINDGSPTFLTRPGQRISAIDLAFISPSIIGLCESITLSDTFFSDHFPVVTLFKRAPLRKKFFSHKFKHSKTLDELFLKNLFSSFGSLKEALSDQSLNPNQKYLTFSEHILQQWPSYSGEARPPKRRPRRRGGEFSPPAPWRNDTCQEAVNARRGLLSILKKQPSFSNYLGFKKQEAISRRVLRAEKRRGWREFCSNLNPNTPVTHLWNFIKRFRTRHFESPKTPSSSNYCPSDTVQNTINSLCPPFAFHQAFSSMKDFPQNYSCKILDHPFSKVELTSVIRFLKIRSSPGLDRVDNRMLSLLPDEYLEILLDIFNHIFDSGSFPAS